MNLATKNPQEMLIVLDYLTPFILICLGLFFKRRILDTASASGFSSLNFKKEVIKWEFIQRIAPDIFLEVGKINLIIIIIIHIIDVILSLFNIIIPYENLRNICSIIGLMCIIYVVYLIQDEVKKKF